MRYMQSLNRRLRLIREDRKLSVSDLARLCGVDERRVEAWESGDPRRREYPSVEELMDLCFKTDSSLDELLDLADGQEAGQLELPGLAFSNGNDLAQALTELESLLAKVQPRGDEVELLAAFREASSKTRRMVMRTLGL
ncbi:MAG: helix-turn-helix transcriptional regulator [Marinobacter sp.]|uniref:helix-turn-helix transcriptional regulator n=1 Tax=Marinobacter sp. TaxID=50741 RepID=UPI00299ECDEF|nr:helix-turn-helix transcriptional regulator [Marinobacter sp.]MDX1754865.1 helix-turn-helix transcriptional regulator [Marinobacter sp.]